MTMNIDGIYQELRKKINERGVGFDKTTSGIEMRILERLFTEEEARMYMQLTWDLESTETIATRVGQEMKTVSRVLENMASKGLVFPKRKDDTRYYAAAPYAHGIFEHQVGRMDPEMAQMFEEYLWSERVPEEPGPDRDIEPASFLDSTPNTTWNREMPDGCNRNGRWNRRRHRQGQMHWLRALCECVSHRGSDTGREARRETACAT